jgi:hypothetical protein
VGSFAVLRHTDEPEFTVDACHLNLWSLAGLFGRRVFLWDVGLTLEAAAGGEKEVKKIDLLLPFVTEPDAFKDLSKEILDQNVARLVFGKSVTADVNTRMVTYPADANRPSLKVEPIFKATLDDDFQKDKWLRRANLSLWTIEFASPLKHGQKSYVRIRFRMRTQGRTWLWMRSKRVALIDVRVADIREIVVPLEAGSKLEAVGLRSVPLSRLNVFVIVPGYLLFRATSPATHYVRLFEGRVWEPYLGGRAVSLWKQEKLMIYQWRFPDESKPAEVKPAAGEGGAAPRAPTINTTDPFRAFLIVGGEQGLRTFLNALLAAALALAGAFILLHPEYVKAGYEWAVETAAGYGYHIPVGGALVLAVLSLIFKYFGPARTALDKGWKLFRDFEDLVFSIRGKLSR